MKPGDRVMGFCGWGAAREEVAVPASALAAMPPSISFEEAAGLIVTFGTTFHALHDRAELRAWRDAGGPRGIGRSRPGGNRAWQGDGGAGHRLRLVGGQACGCRLLGADEVVNYSQVELRDELKRLTDGRGVDVVYDPVGTLSEAALRATGWDEGDSGDRLCLGNDPQDPAQSRVAEGLRGGRGVLGRSLAREPDKHRANMAKLAELYDSGQIRPRIDRVFPLEEAAAALGVLSRREAQGKVILAVGKGEQ